MSTDKDVKRCNEHSGIIIYYESPIIKCPLCFYKTQTYENATLIDEFRHELKELQDKYNDLRNELRIARNKLFEKERICKNCKFWKYNREEYLELGECHNLNNQLVHESFGCKSWKETGDE